MSIPLKTRGISASKHKSLEFAVLFLNFSGRKNVEDLIYASLQCEIHFVGGFWANLLIGNNIMSSKAIVINLGKKSALIDAC